MRFFTSIEEARQAFEPFARLEPELLVLWDMCLRPAPAARRTHPVDDAFDIDSFDSDLLAADQPDEGWCAEDYFHDNVKSKLLILVGVYRIGGPHELQTTEAYDTVYDILLNWALVRPCPCCAQDDDDRGPWHRGDHWSPADR
jgi:hypothetical protein